MFISRSVVPLVSGENSQTVLRVSSLMRYRFTLHFERVCGSPHTHKHTQTLGPGLLKALYRKNPNFFFLFRFFLLFTFYQDMFHCLLYILKKKSMRKFLISLLQKKKKSWHCFKPRISHCTLRRRICVSSASLNLRRCYLNIIAHAPHVKATLNFPSLEIVIKKNLFFIQKNPKNEKHGRKEYTLSSVIKKKFLLKKK